MIRFHTRSRLLNRRTILVAALSIFLAAPAMGEMISHEDQVDGTTVSTGLAAKKDIPQILNQGAEQPVDQPGAMVRANKDKRVIVNGSSQPLHRNQGFETGYFVPDNYGGYIWVGSIEGATPPSQSNDSARELKLKARELADQLLANVSDSMRGSVALPTSFVNQDNLRQSSSLGRYLAEQLFYEFNQRGFPVQEYRADTMIQPRREQGEFLLHRRGDPIYVQSPNQLIITGTYYYDRENIFVNARMVRGADGMVMGTGSLVFAQNKVTQTMLARGSMQLGGSSISLRDHDTMVRDTDLTSIDLGEDIH